MNENARNHAAIALLRSWRDGDATEQQETLACLKESLAEGEIMDIVPKLAHVVCAHVPADSGGTTLAVWSVLLGGDSAAAEMEAERMTEEDEDGNIYFAVTVPIVQKQGAQASE